MTKTDVAKAKGSQVPANLLEDMEADAVIHAPKFDADMLTIPRIKILQDLSPETKPGAAFLEGSRPGLILNESNSKLDEEIIFTPSSFVVRYIAWKPRKAGGGLVDPNLTLKDVEDNFEADGIGSWTGMMKVRGPDGREDPVRVEVHQTPVYMGIAKGKGWGPMPVAISMPSTKVKAARKMNTSVELTEMQGRNGLFRPPMFYHQFILRTGVEQSGEQSWHGFVVQHLGCAGHPSASADIDLDMIQRAKRLAEQVKEGKAKADDSNLEK